MQASTSINGIDLWKFALDGGPEAVNAALAVLCVHERAHFRQFENPHVAAVFALRRAARRIILASYLGIEPTEVATCDTLHGKPELSGSPPDLYFSASHSKDCGILAVTHQFSLGADVEHLRPVDTLSLAARILSPTEQLGFDAVAPPDRAAWIFRIWTAKEAVVKGIGVGLDLRDLPLISLPTVPAAAVWRPVELDGRMNLHGRWQVYSLVPSTGQFISLASPRPALVREIDARALLAVHGV